MKRKQIIWLSHLCNRNCFRQFIYTQPFLYNQRWFAANFSVENDRLLGVQGEPSREVESGYKSEKISFKI